MTINAKDFVFCNSNPIKNGILIKGPQNTKNDDFNLDDYLAQLKNMGFQASNLGKGIDLVNKMLAWKLSDEEILEDETEPYNKMVVRENTKCVKWLSFTSNMISSGLREVFIYLAKNKYVDVIVTSAGGIEEDFIKVLGDTYLGDFSMNGKLLRENGWNRAGNIIIPNDNYVKFENWLQPLLDEMLEKQKKENIIWTPSKLIHFLGKKINNENSLYYWCYKNNIPVFCPGITDGSLGDNIYFYTYKNPELIIDLVQDIRLINDIGLKAKKSGIIILGGGLPKHHVCNANLMRNGADYAVYITTATEYDGSDSGASPDEAVSWGKIRSNSEPVKIIGDATIIFPLLVSQTFSKL